MYDKYLETELSVYVPTKLPDLLTLVAEKSATLIAGGTDVYPSLEQGKAPQTLIDVTRVEALKGITASATGFRIGAATTWSDIIAADLPPAFDGLKAASREVGSVQIQNAGTIAGNLCNASPAADGVPPLLTLDAVVEVSSAARGVRHVPLTDFITGVRKVDLAADELLTAIEIPTLPTGAGSAFQKLGARRYLVISMTMTAALIRCDAKGRIDTARVAVGACSPVAQRLSALEKDLIGQHKDEVRIEPAHLECLSPIDDVRGSGTFRLDVVAEQCARAIAQAANNGSSND